MEVILMERVDKLGQMGDVVSVKPGFARNYLLPQKKAMRATDANKARFEVERAQLEAANLKRREEAQAVADKMNGLSVVLVRQAGEAGQLYGSVNTRDIADSLKEAGFTIGRWQIVLNTPIKTLGLFDVPVALHPEVVISVTVNVARSQDEADIQAKTGQALVGQHDEPVAAVPAVEEVFEDEVQEQVQADLSEAEAEVEEVVSDVAEEAPLAEGEEEPKAE